MGNHQIPESWVSPEFQVTFGGRVQREGAKDAKENKNKKLCLLAASRELIFALNARTKRQNEKLRNPSCSSCLRG